MAFGAAVSRPTCNGVVLKGEGTNLIGMAGDTHCLDDWHLFAVRFAGMDIVAIAADHSPFRDGMVEVEAKFADLFLVARTAQRPFVPFQQSLRLRCRHKKRAQNEIAVGLFLVLRPPSLVPMNLVAIGASDIGLSVGSAMPLAQAHRVGVAAKASEGDGFWRGFAETDNFRQVLDFHEVNFARTMTGFATAFVKGQLGVADIKGVRGAGKTFGEGAMAPGALFVADEIFGFCLSKEVQREGGQLRLVLARHDRQRPKERQHHRTKTPLVPVTMAR